MKSHSYILSESVPILREDQVEGPEDLNIFSEQVSTNLGAHLQMASCRQPLTPGGFLSSSWEKVPSIGIIVAF